MRRRLTLLILAAAGFVLFKSSMGTGIPMESSESPAAAQRVEAHIQMLAGTIGERNVWHPDRLARAADYIQAQLAGNGYEPRQHTYAVAGLPVSNVEATLEGLGRREESVVVGAHYDSVAGSPGANDNATGVAALLELSGRLRNRSRARTVRFVAFVNEEPPFFRTGQMGSLVYATAARSRGERIVGMLSLETMGYYSDARGSQRYPAPMGLLYPDAGNFIGFVSDLRSAPLLFAARRAFKQQTAFPLRVASVPAARPGIGWSDHWAFWQAGYPAIMVTDTAPFRYPWYHTAGDTPDKVSPAKLARVIDGLENVIAVLANR
jgi:Zn-dependent M28 family amino/carboxypeptidase